MEYFPSREFTAFDLITQFRKIYRGLEHPEVLCAHSNSMLLVLVAHLMGLAYHLNFYLISTFSLLKALPPLLSQDFSLNSLFLAICLNPDQDYFL